MTNPALAVAAWAAAHPLPTGTVPRGRMKKNESTTIPRIYGFQPNGGIRSIHIQLPKICGAERLCICISGAGTGCGMVQGWGRRKNSN